MCWLAMAASETAPPLDILVRGPEGFSLWNGPPFSNGQPGIKLENISCTSTKFSEDGSRLMVMKSDSVISIYDCSSYREIRSFQIPNVAAAALSHVGLMCKLFRNHQRHRRRMSSYGTPRLVILPSIRFSSDEAVACRLATNEIQFLDAGDFSKPFIYRLRVPGVAAFELSKAPGSHVAAFVPESKGIPASVQIFSCAKAVQSQPLARRSFFRCSSVQLNWNKGSTGLLVVVQSDVDKTNQSYYGESKLNYLTTDGTHEGLVPLLMPSKATVFDKKCNPLLELGTGPYNTIRWNPKGKCFGNLPGDMAFWDYGEKKQLGTTRAELSVTSEWSPDGCYFMTATTAPRLQVDNGIKIFHHNGSLFFKKMFDKLYQADWKPESPDRFGDIAELVKSIGSLKVVETKPQGDRSKISQTSAKASASNPPAQKPAAYRPPHAKSAAAVQAQLFGESSTETVSKNALKNKKKREKQREKKAAEATSDT
ncbi:Eukaryotic translation initiation factor eIF2A family protein [Prunus dulcis]|uniref:Eukaryotic translation initiation factor eIF2A family protein n=1 Tax=Prunus dulcis TaxID=3755 RepID=A0A5H2YFZ7_PRUDU|nr:Eukaryotic translation initiation factor eIF2A family protein [Prunus dulcis]